MSFRFVSIGVTFFLRPRAMLAASTSSCLVSSLGIAMLADQNRDLCYALTFVFGFSISWQYGSMYSWLARHMDLVVSRVANFFFLGRQYPTRFRKKALQFI